MVNIGKQFPASFACIISIHRLLWLIFEKAIEDIGLIGSLFNEFNFWQGLKFTSKGDPEVLHHI